MSGLCHSSVKPLTMWGEVWRGEGTLLRQGGAGGCEEKCFFASFSAPEKEIIYDMTGARLLAEQHLYTKTWALCKKVVKNALLLNKSCIFAPVNKN